MDQRTRSLVFASILLASLSVGILGCSRRYSLPKNYPAAQAATLSGAVWSIDGVIVPFKQVEGNSYFVTLPPTLVESGVHWITVAPVRERRVNLKLQLEPGNSYRFSHGSTLLETDPRIAIHNANELRTLVLNPDSLEYSDLDGKPIKKPNWILQP